MLAYLIRVATSLSQLVNTLIGGHPDQTLSARAYVNRHRVGWGVAYQMINTIYFWQTDHCFESHLDDLEFAREVLDVGR